jgi:sugar/nucleoside kinase (ribokinase family)
MKKILGIGNALVDIITFLKDDELLESISFPKGTMQLVDLRMARRIEKITNLMEKHMTSGGSAANTIHGLAKLGVKTGFIGTVGKDPLGNFFKEDLISAGITPLLFESNLETGRAISLVTPDSERTFATFLGAAIELNENILDTSLLKDYQHIHIEGYLVQNQNLVIKCLELARQQAITLSLDLASYNVVEANLDFLRFITRQKHIDILFANEEEARVFTGFSDPHMALEKLSGICDFAVVKTGEKGSLISHCGKKSEVDIYKANCLDTTGAGDLYAAGFLFGFVKGLEPLLCGRIGSMLASKVIEIPGAKITPVGWAVIDQIMREEMGIQP